MKVKDVLIEIGTFECIPFVRYVLSCRDIEKRATPGTRTPKTSQGPGNAHILGM